MTTQVEGQRRLGASQSIAVGRIDHAKCRCRFICATDVCGVMLGVMQVQGLGGTPGFEGVIAVGKVGQGVLIDHGKPVPATGDP